MITIEQAKVIGTVLKRFNDNEPLGWNDVDDAIVCAAWLNDQEVIAETGIWMEKHKGKNARCPQVHSNSVCFVPSVIEAVSYIVDDFASSKRLAKKARFVLEYYIAFSSCGEIIFDNY